MKGAASGPQGINEGVTIPGGTIISQTRLSEPDILKKANVSTNTVDLKGQSLQTIYGYSSVNCTLYEIQTPTGIWF